METKCKRCGSRAFVKNDIVRGFQRYRCRDCGYNFTPSPKGGRSPANKALAILLYGLGKAGFRWLAKLLGVSDVSVHRRVRYAAEELLKPQVREEIRHMEFDELWHFLAAKKNQCWIWRAYGRESCRCVAWEAGSRDRAPLRRLRERGSHAGRTCYTDKRAVYPDVIPPSRHVVGQAASRLIESDNADTRHRVAPFPRRTKGVSRSVRMVDLTMRLWAYLEQPSHFAAHQVIFLSILR